VNARGTLLVATLGFLAALSGASAFAGSQADEAVWVMTADSPQIKEPRSSTSPGKISTAFRRGMQFDLHERLEDGAGKVRWDWKFRFELKGVIPKTIRTRDTVQLQMIGTASGVPKVGNLFKMQIVQATGFTLKSNPQKHPKAQRHGIHLGQRKGSAPPVMPPSMILFLTPIPGKPTLQLVIGGPNHANIKYQWKRW